MQLVGELEDIIFRNDTNSYTVASFIVHSMDESISNSEQMSLEDQGIKFARELSTVFETTIVGFLPFINPGDNLKLVGKFVTHPDYGEQFKVETFEKVMPQTLDALERYLGNGLIKGVGKATARKIVKEFGEDTIEVIKAYPEKLVKIKGITPEKAIEISESFNESWDMWQIVGFLDKFGIGAQSAQSIYKTLGANTIEKIQNDPYILEDCGVKVDFAQIDKMALSIGIERTSLRRIGSGIIHALNLATYNGHTCVLESNLISFTMQLLGVSEDDVINGLVDLKAKDKIAEEDRESMVTVDGVTEFRQVTWVYLKNYFDAELNIARKIKALQESENLKKFANVDKRIKQVSELPPSEKQIEAIHLVNDNNVAIITGGPGTGKTTIIKTLIELYESIGKKTVLCAPTGRAAKRMTEATGKEAKTLHRLLEINKIGEEKPNPDLNVAPIDADVIIIDEMSMVDLFLMNYCLNGIFKGTKLVMVGDVDQLASVGPGCVLKDLIDSGKVPYIALNKIFRQAAKSKIIVNAHKVNEGINFIEEKSSNDETINDFEFDNQTNPQVAQSMILANYDFDTQIITPTKKGDLGTRTLNELIQKRYNPEDEKKHEKKFGSVIFREGDKVMQTKNNYDIEWTKRNATFGFEVEYGSGIFNGEMGIIENIDRDGTIEIRFEDGKVANYVTQDLEQIEHCFAITIHKSQGSEFEKVLMPILGAAPMLLTRNVLYTGMTRAKNKLTIIGSSNTIEFMIKNTDSKKRNSGLKFKLEQVL